MRAPLLAFGLLVVAAFAVSALPSASALTNSCSATFRDGLASCAFICLRASNSDGRPLTVQLETIAGYTTIGHARVTCTGWQADCYVLSFGDPRSCGNQRTQWLGGNGMCTAEGVGRATVTCTG